ncbi:rsbT co-antagonist protein RsbR [Streptomyces sp. SAI-208]|uniref:STAS domain-containing protein n=1 Tax=unclassified Streptomyces TaxID=2593676 RepID=UPI0024756971|nr:MULTISPECIES: STAS domain-containing protein [unclassified Streptomyces]MDH6514384.1 rsbT co-antagonist protein RsbR [Streptomyces sp. SAI-090]MDH6546565.1 rsbT co-antagonist protein RsbR [Streptomyces sp. SAI-041]MDH6565668.1 rsbT co-antagonist protein RsbR [Streptomyces sp. SAI-117]MDH6589415.1 rsbT co-antagonist protein RsbR [Streptomyces sp. SAI-133]MDH6605227.1 rsbT co-antagonist protein RsbR [Streptomyces sp. SAI-208]
MQVAQHDTALETAKELGAFLERRREQIAQRWADAALFRTVFTVSRDEAVEACKAVVDALADVARSGRLEDVDAPGFDTVRDQLGRMAAARARAGFTPVQIAGEVAGLREPAAALLLADFQDTADEARANACAQALAVLTATLRLVIMETTVSAGEELIARQRQQLLEVATPVIKLWDGIVAVPLIGTLDSARSQVVMESLLEAIVDQRAAYAILDITGVPTVDSLVAQHLMKTVAAARLMGAECIVSGIRPAIAQTIVHLGIDLGSIITRAGLADALAYALAQQGIVVSPRPVTGAVPR